MGETNDLRRWRSWCCGLQVIGLILLIAGCSSSNYAPVQDLERPPKVTQGIHVVKRGETLYSIAWRYGRDFRELAGRNGIRAPYAIKPGQKISLAQYRAPRKTAAPNKSAAASRAKPSAPKRAPAKKTAVKPTYAARVNWAWPVRGKVVNYFNATGRKGIDIAAAAGTTVKAAADGVVVYAGSGLIGYGNLVIIKHNEHYLSAYAHNRKILVGEQKKVKAGQKIAETGSTGAKRPILHFEIRKNGKPVNPLTYLPK